MLISITDKCRMGCSHCMDDARADSTNFMTRQMFEKAIDFNLKYDASITITGGEPTEHPQFWDFMKILSKRMTKDNICSITSNGMNLSDADIDRIIELRKSKGEFLWQISSIPPYYPIKIDTNQNVFKLPEFVVARELQKLDPIGRAKLHPEWNFNAKAPQCFNFRSIIRSTHDFYLTIVMQRARLRFCTPQIGYDGSIKVGESTLCPAVANIFDSEKEIVDKICNFKCDGCREVLNKLPQNYRNAIGEN